MKRCYVCKMDLSFDMFGKNRSKSSGLADECKKCKSIKDKAYRESNKVKCKKRARNYYVKYAKEISRKSCIYAKVNKERHNAWGAKAKRKLKMEVLSHYSNGELKCTGCPESNLRILTIDHIEGNGANHRRELFGNSKKCGYDFYMWLKKSNLPDGFQTLCHNCQFRKRAIEMKPDNPSKKQLMNAACVRSVKIECLNNYGGCECQCGEKDIEVLTLDHVNNDGSKHRKETNTRGYTFYAMLKREKFPANPPLQTMCMNCQIRKRSNHEKNKSCK